MSGRTVRRLALEVIAVGLSLVLFGVPLLFVVLNAGMDVRQAATMRMELPKNPQYLENIATVVATADHMLLRALYNSTVITALSIAVLVVVASLAGFVMERNKGRAMPFITFLIMAGLMVPPSVVTTIWVLQGVGLYKTIAGMVMIEVALALPFTALLYRGYLVTLPRELDEAAFMEGCTGWRLFWSVVFPLLRPVTSTVIVLSAVAIFNDFVNPLYFLPGARNVTIQLTLYNFMTRFSTEWNLLFTNVLLISLPPLVVFIIFNKRIVAGIVAGAIKA